LSCVPLSRRSSDYPAGKDACEKWDTNRHRGTLPQLRRRLEDHRRPFDTLRTGIEDPPVIVKILSHLGLPTRAPPRVPARRVDLFQTI